MKRPLVAIVAVAAMFGATSAASAATPKHHKAHHASDQYQRPAGAVYGMVAPAAPEPAPEPAPASARFDPCGNVNTATVGSCNHLSVNGL